MRIEFIKYVGRELKILDNSNVSVLSVCDF